jgi:hypothetical protein
VKHIEVARRFIEKPLEAAVQTAVEVGVKSWKLWG